MRLHSCLLPAACAVGFLGTAAAAVPYPHSNMPSAVDLGLTQNVAPGTEVTLTVPLKLRNTAQLQSLLQSVYTPGSANYHQFLTSRQFAAQFGPTADTVAQLTRHFQADGFTVTRSATAQLKITGTIQAVQAEFGVRLHEYAEGATAKTPAFQFRAPDRAASLSSAIAGSVEGVLGLSTQPRFHPNLLRPLKLSMASRATPVGKAAGAPATTDPPGLWTVVDFGQYYDVDPLYRQGLSGKGQTLGILTLASFTQSDAYYYWKTIGLKVNHDRITEIPVDGGSGSPSDASGSDETTLDVEQSGGIAPGANILVYEAPNEPQGFVDLFATAVDQDKASSLSVSWGEWEWYDTQAFQDVADPYTGENETTLRALNNVLIQAALQGQSVFTAAGDAGAYDANRYGDPFTLPYFTQILSVDDPAAQPFITACGGTTLPGTQTYTLSGGGTISISIPEERAWGWDYLNPLFAALGINPIDYGYFPVGGGGGVSSYIGRPLYQWFTPGMASTPGGQKLVDTSGTALPPGFNLPVKLPAGYSGRNVPDISVNSDPQTGYILYYTSDQNGFEEITLGGTSFAAPQLNGVTALYGQGMQHQRLGLWNFALYGLLDSGHAYWGKQAPLRDITSGDNEYWQARPGYDQATGVGVPDVANLFHALGGR
jgi:kumamolisin